MKKYGFTLVELLAVIAILGVLALLITPTVFKSINKFNEESYTSQITSIETAAREWATDNVQKVAINSGTTFYVTIGQLKQDGYLKKDLENPNAEMNSGATNKEWFANDSKIAIEKVGNRFNATYQTYSGDSSESTNSNLTTNAPVIELSGTPVSNVTAGSNYPIADYRATSASGTNLTGSVQVTCLKDNTVISSDCSAISGLTSGSVYTIIYKVTGNGVTQAVARNLICN